MKLKQPLTTSEARSLEPVLQRQLQRLQAPRSLIAFTEFTFPRYETAGLHRQIAEQLERVERGEIDRLMLNVPPRHGKSELTSRRFPAWFLGNHPDKHFISASASFSLAEEFGRDVRNLVKSDDYAAVFDGVRLAEDSRRHSSARVASARLSPSMARRLKLKKGQNVKASRQQPFD